MILIYRCGLNEEKFPTSEVISEVEYISDQVYELSREFHLCRYVNYKNGNMELFGRYEYLMLR